MLDIQLVSSSNVQTLWEGIRSMTTLPSAAPPFPPLTEDVSYNVGGPMVMPTLRTALNSALLVT